MARGSEACSIGCLDVAAVAPLSERHTNGGAALAGVGLLHGAETEKKGDEQEAEVGPPEDLMREHGVLKRCF